MGDASVGDAAGGGAGTVIEIGPGASSSTLITGLDFTGGIAVDSAGDIFVAELLNSTFENQISRFDAAGAPVAPTPFTGPSFAIGSFDLALGSMFGHYPQERYVSRAGAQQAAKHAGAQ